MDPGPEFSFRLRVVWIGDVVLVTMPLWYRGRKKGLMSYLSSLCHDRQSFTHSLDLVLRIGGIIL